MTPPNETATCDRLAAALAEAGAPAAMIAKAAAGYYDDYKSPLAFPIMQLRADALALGLGDIAERAADGDFDGTKAEADAWAASPDGQAAFSDLLGRDST